MPKKDIKPISQKLSVMIHGNQVIEMTHKGKFTRDEIKKYAQKESNALHKAGHKGQISVCLLMPEGWKSGYFSNVGSPVSMYEFKDSDIDRDEVNTFTNFQMYLTKFK